ncbi:ATP-binding protein [Geodermatophilus sp. DSM 45219]|uniref:ATP-binding protein n=1 Tax=Geodermatophilus sp. DSM 45219 TaxID=1881103 RepID=UPI00089250B6|nr:ATP-binding protein [Geodermatophilus sp. DSM 45219]SDO35102.1 phage shock protein C (PspC) family protein [Geodermatophilus sp. DSM 45219]
MTTTLPVPVRPPLVRPRSGRLLAGVAAGTAAHLQADPLVVRVAFVLLASTGIGVVAYALLWFFMPVADADAAPVADGATEEPSRRQTLGLGLLGLGALILVTRLGSWGGGDLVLPLLLVVLGLTVIWRQLDTDRTLTRPAVPWLLAAGVLLGVAGVVLLLATTGQLDDARNGFTATLVILAGVALATAPLWRRLLASREAERTARARSEERAAVAAHLHDSVLQTLALIQRHADDATAVSRLARSQERELRTWLYEPAVAAGGGTWASLVSGVVAEVEADHALTVESVVVGDAPLDDALAALGAATREALVNAAKHSGAAVADLYTEVGPQRVAVFVRDRGAGFDPATVPGDRRGLRDSVTGRLTRLGGTATVRSAPGEGTEVELCLPRQEAAA